MIEKIIDKLRNKKIAILGFGREGKSSYKFLRKYLKEESITILDANKMVAEDSLLKDDNYTDVYVESNYLDILDNFDYILKSPGISLKGISTKTLKRKITSQIELLLETGVKNTIGITGTKGKSTTTSLIYEILKNQGKDVVLAGNIEIPVFSILEDCNENTFFVMELSSHQLEFLEKSPHIGIILNLFEDHLDHAGSIEHYHNNKLKMFQYQTKEDIMVYCSDNETLNRLVNSRKYNSTPYSVNLKNQDEKAAIFCKDKWIYYKEKAIYSIEEKRRLLGNHNLENIMVALLVSEILELNRKKTLETIRNFEPLAYRLQFFKKVDGIEYYIDTLATIPKATIEAIETLKNVNTLIFGGLDRGISYDELIHYLQKSKVEHFICMPTTGHKIGKLLPKDKVYFVDDLKSAVSIAKTVTKENTICLLSPAAASYEQFKNYREKGEKFKEYILEEK